jgi:hypothetical protein
MTTSSATRRARSRPGLGLFCLTALLHDPCWGAPPAPSIQSTLPCTDPLTRVARDTHVAFPDENLERLALRLSSGLYADRQIYDRLVRDVKTIRARAPELKSVRYFARQDARVLNVFFNTFDVWRVRAHLYGDWNCLNTFLGAQVVVHPELHFVQLTFAGLYNPDWVSKAYRALPGVTLTESGGLLGGGSSIFVTREDAVWHYLFDIAGGDCPSGCTTHDMHYFEVAADGRVQKAATWNADAHAPPPDWAIAHFRKYD